MNILVKAALVGALSALSTSGSAEGLALPRFDQLELRGGGEVHLRYGPVQQVSIVQGSAEISRIRVDRQRSGRGRLVIEPCASECPRGYKLEIEIVTPELAGAAVQGGGSIRTEGAFPDHGSIALAVQGGGEIDARTAGKDSVVAAVDGGGLILARAGVSLTAAVSGGGEIRYWGSPTVIQNVNGGGAIERGGQ